MGVLGGRSPPNTPNFLPHSGDSERTFLINIEHGRGKMCNNEEMTLRRKILLGLLVPALVMVVVQIFRPNDGLELLCLVFALPVAVVNAWEWTSLDGPDWENLRARYQRDFQPVKLLRDWRLAFAAWHQSSSTDQEGELTAAPAVEPELEEAAPTSEPETRNRKISNRTYGILFIAAGALIMADVFIRTGFRMGMLVAGMLGFIAFTAGLYLTFG